MISLQEKFSELDKLNKALLATNFYNFETLSGILCAARNKNVPLILQATKSTIQYLGLEVTVGLAHAARSQYNVEAWLHLDHASDIDLIERCIQAGFDSVMIDASESPYETNIRKTRQVVEMAKLKNVNVEAELGYVAKLGQSREKVRFTQPEEAKEFVDRTGVNALAVAIGSAHGFYKKEPKLDLILLNKIYRNTSAALVLHGGSGIPNIQLSKAITNGIRKINVATELKNTFMSKLRTDLGNTKEIDLRKIFPPAIKEVQRLIESKIDVIYN